MLQDYKIWCDELGKEPKIYKFYYDIYKFL